MRNTCAGHLAISPIPVIRAAIGKGNLALALRFARYEQPFVDRSIRKPGCTSALNLARDPFAGVFITIGKFVGAGAILTAIFEGAFID